MAGLVPAIHVFLCRRAQENKTWMPATPARSRASLTRYGAGMTTERLTQLKRKSM